MEAGIMWFNPPDYLALTTYQSFILSLVALQRIYILLLSPYY